MGAADHSLDPCQGVAEDCSPSCLPIPDFWPVDCPVLVLLGGGSPERVGSHPKLLALGVIWVKGGAAESLGCPELGEKEV